MSESVYGEIVPRLFRNGGELRITMTPTPEAPPQLWLKDKIDEDRKKTEDSEKKVEKDGGTPRRRRWIDVQTPISEEALTPTGGLINRPFKTQAEIDELLEEYLQDELHQRRDGAWEGVLSGRWLTNYGDEAQTEDSPVGTTWWAVGIDHGAKAGRERAVLVGYSEETDRAIICQEYASGAAWREITWTLAGERTGRWAGSMRIGSTVSDRAAHLAVDSQEGALPFGAARTARGTDSLETASNGRSAHPQRQTEPRVLWRSHPPVQWGKP